MSQSTYDSAPPITAGLPIDDVEQPDTGELGAPVRRRVPAHKDPLFIAGALLTVGLVLLVVGRRGCSDCARRRKIDEQLGPAAAHHPAAAGTVAGPGERWPRPANAPEPSAAGDNPPVIGAPIDPYAFVVVEGGDGVEQLARVNGAADLGEALSNITVPVAPNQTVSDLV